MRCFRCPRIVLLMVAEETARKSTRLKLPEIGPGSPGGLGRRMAAIFIDWFACLAVAVVLNGGFVADRFDPALVTLILFAVQVTLLTWLQAASFGQRLMQLVVAPVGRPRVSLLRAALRTALLCLVIPAVVMDSNGRGLHDLAAGTVVVRR